MKEFNLEQIGARVRYHDLPGAGTPILFIHGLGCASSFDYPQVVSEKGLEGHRRVLVDLLGSGYSDKPARFPYTIEAHADYLLAFIEHLELKSLILFGHSMGGAVALSLASRCQERLKGLVLSEANLDPGGGFFSKRVAAYSEQEFVSSGFSRTIEESRAGGNEQWAASLSVCSPLAVYRQSKSLVDGESPSWRELLYSMKIPRTFIFGENSLPDPDLERLDKEGIHIEIVKSAGHSMAWENPQGLAGAIKNGISMR